MIEDAIYFATTAHSGQKRKGTDIPYILHPLEAATIATRFEYDEILICAAILHDVVEDTDTALALTEDAFKRVHASNTKVIALLERVRGFALAAKGDAKGGRRAMEASLVAGWQRRDSFEIAQTLRALIALDRAQGVEPDAGFVVESDSLLASLKVREAPAIPLASLSPK
jgi:hypothetical protein